MFGDRIEFDKNFWKCFEKFKLLSCIGCIDVFFD